MARSTYVYVARTADGAVVAAFTVKHELIRWIGNNPDACDNVLRLRDGGYGEPEVMIQFGPKLICGHGNVGHTSACHEGG